jgi:hypothetical protein
MSGEATPILSGTIPAFEVFMTEWEKIRATNSRLKHWIDEGMRWAVKYYIRMDQTKAYVIAMCEYNYCGRLKSILKRFISSQSDYPHVVDQKELG